ncbi:hypothetical protein ACFWFU_04585 [Streptomyces sp. NPDC060235]|uniref:hypothetical protein n=1 Tax=Streptomyces sp. NPDC060235 TaxID=3347080 RepID=UPI00365E3234
MSDGEKAREEAGKAAKKATEALAVAVRVLIAKVSVSGAGAILSVSHQYVAKLASKSS